MSDMIDYYEEVLLLRKKVEKYETLLKHAMAEKTGVFFICGASGEKDSTGLPEYISVCPAYGADGMTMYKKHKDYSAPGW
jgi:N-acetylglutamate synthase-like GNAT family acetyltransferase